MKNRVKTETGQKIFSLVVILSLLAAWIMGKSRQNSDLYPYLQQALPGAEKFEIYSKDIFTGIVSVDSAGEIVGYVAVGEARGYGGPLQTATGLDSTGIVLGIAVVDHKETPAFFQKILRKQLPSALIGKKYSDPFQIGEDVDGVTGATRTAKALTLSVARAGRSIAKYVLGVQVEAEPENPILFGLREMLLILLFATGFLSYGKNRKYKKSVRWLVMGISLPVLGFVYSIPVTLANINSFLMGFWPDWHTHLYWFLLLSGVFLPMVFLGKSPYCSHICPFGAAQECLGAIGGTKIRLKSSLHNGMRWLQRLLAWLVILLALFYRNPSYAGYEVFGPLFNLTGSSIQFGLLGVVLIASLFLKRPWCLYLCPVRAVTDFVKMIRNGVISLWRKNSKTAEAAPNPSQ
jgi:NosR/NirI family nitrous oxide reductase transcriptional regulator